jgi:hypothetical protein
LPGVSHKLNFHHDSFTPPQASINGTAIRNYKGGIITDEKYANMGHSHGVSIIGWGMNEENGKKHWIVRNRYVCAGFGHTHIEIW